MGTLLFAAAKVNMTKKAYVLRFTLYVLIFAFVEKYVRSFFMFL